ncbi:MAG: homoserine dehydrogenase [Chloroflexota bacterium]
MEPSVATHQRPLRVALVGLGTVGKAVAAQLLDPTWRAAVSARGLVPPVLTAVGVRDPDRPRGIVLPRTVKRTANLMDLAVDPSYDVIVEVIGGTDDAGLVVRQALAWGKPVVTANKALLAEKGASLERVARDSDVALRFEAAVGGGIPVLAPLVSDLSSNQIEAVRGIVNGTTNHILSAMAEDGRDYADVLAESQERGYAEADPSGDVEGHDAANKLAVLTRLAFDTWPDVRRLRFRAPSVSGDAAPGITCVRLYELERAAELGLTLKLVARAEPGEDGGVRAAVTPVAVKATSPLGATGGVTNLIEVVAEPVGRVSFRGPGAGGPATAAAILSDLLAIGRDKRISTWGHLPPARAAAPVRDDLDGDRAWFFVLRELLGAPMPKAVEEVALASAGDAFVTRPIALDALRARLAPLGCDVPLYPVIPEA